MPLRTAICAVLACVLPLLSLAADTPRPSKPNILLILTDDMGYGDLGCYGGEVTPTPNIDRLAAEGVKFQQFYVASPICSPSRVGYTTGMFPGRWRINSYLQTRAGDRHCEQADWLDPAAPSLARTLKDSGYATGHFGKWHMGGGRDVQDAPLPSAYGFDEHFVNCEGMGPRIPDFGVKGPEMVEGKLLPRHQFTEFFVDKAIDFLHRHKDQPFYLNVWPMDVHDPHMPSERLKKKYADSPPPQGFRNFHAVLDEYDRQIGRLLDAVRELGLEENTIIVFTSDNGPNPSFEHQRSGGLRGQKWSLYEGGIREPFIIKWKGKTTAGVVNDSTILCSVDLFPSLCKLAGVAAPADARFDGEDLSPALLGRTAARAKPLLWEYGRKPDGYLYPKPLGDKSPKVAIRDGQWKLLLNTDGTDAELYDIDADPKESSNVAAAHPEVVKRLSDQALAWRKSLP